MRNYKKESDWQKKRYTLIKANINKELGTNLKNKLKKEGKTIAGWISENAQKYLENKKS